MINHPLWGPEPWEREQESSMREREEDSVKEDKATAFSLLVLMQPLGPLQIPGVSAL